MSQKLSIARVSNGFIVKITKHGDSMFKEPYSPSVYVFETQEKLNEFLAGFWGQL